MSSEIPLPLGNHPLSHRMRSSLPFIQLIVICNFKFVLQIYTVSAGQLIKNFYLISSQFLLHYSYLVLCQVPTGFSINHVIVCGSCFGVLLCRCPPWVGHHSNCLTLKCWVKHLLLNLFCLKLLNFPNTWGRKLSENTYFHTDARS